MLNEIRCFCCPSVREPELKTGHPDAQMQASWPLRSRQQNVGINSSSQPTTSVHHLLTRLLLPVLEKTAAQHGSDVRVISISSNAHSMAPSIDTITSTEHLCAASRWIRYGASNTINTYFAAELARRYPPIISVSAHLGVTSYSSLET